MCFKAFANIIISADKSIKKQGTGVCVIIAIFANMEKEILQILAEEIVPAEGCTEPIALAYAAALVSDALNSNNSTTSTKAPLLDKWPQMDVYLSGNMIKNVKSVHIPNAEGKVGIETAVAMGALLVAVPRS